MSSSHLTYAEGFRRQRGEPEKQASRSAKPGPDSCSPQFDPILLGESVAVRRLRSQIQRIAPYFRTALVSGEDGSGKQLVARVVHALSPGADGPFVVDCAARLAEYIDRDGRHEGSAAVAAQLESAYGGTLYLHGVGELSLPQQAALSQFIRSSEGRHAAVAESRRTSIHQFIGPRSDTRILAASDHDLRALSVIGQFRRDLYTRLSVVEIEVPPLRRRAEDIPVLASWLLRRLAEETGKPPKVLAKATLAEMQERLWPGNFRELERVITQAAELAEDNLIEPRHLLAVVEFEQSKSALVPKIGIERLHDVVQQHVLDVLTRCGGNKLRAAELLGISRSTLYRMLDARSASSRPLTE
jgi:DNA-binding NtrC family response regulator